MTEPRIQDGGSWGQYQPKDLFQPLKQPKDQTFKKKKETETDQSVLQVLGVKDLFFKNFYITV